MTHCSKPLEVVVVPGKLKTFFLPPFFSAAQLSDLGGGRRSEYMRKESRKTPFDFKYQIPILKTKTT